MTPFDFKGTVGQRLMIKQDDYDLILANVPPHVRNKICNLPIL